MAGEQSVISFEFGDVDDRLSKLDAIVDRDI